jgi:SAM-dependent methyltransferase
VNLGRSGLRLPPRGRLSPTGPVDFVEHYYRGPSRWVFRARLRWLLRELPTANGAVLELGYGSGVFLYSLHDRASTVVGLDVHEHGAEVRKAVATDGVRPGLLRADAGRLPFRSASFDAVVAVSTLEFVPDPDATLAEALRVTRPGGRVVCIVPRQLPWADKVFTLMTGTNPEDDFAGRRETVQAALESFSPDGGPRPRWLPRPLAPYRIAILERS